MKKVFLLLFGLAVILTACNDSQETSHIDNFGINQAYAATIPNDYSNLQAEASNESTVYICTGPNSKRYHKYYDCRGLGRCSGDIKAVSVSKAQSLGRTPCKVCY
jgi:hypothetical protein